MGRVADRVLRRLRAAGEIDIQQGRGADLLVSVLGAKPTTLSLEIKHRFSEEVLQQFKTLTAHHQNLVLVVPTLSPMRRAQLQDLALSWIEYLTGFVHIRAPGLAIDLPPNTTELARKTPNTLPSLAGKAGNVVEALVELASEREYVEQPTVAELSGSTQAWTSRVFAGLVRAGALEVTGSGPNKVWHPIVERLLDLWIEDGGGSPESTAMYVWARTPKELLVNLSALENTRFTYAIGGAAAADLHEPTLTSPPTPSVWIPSAVPPHQAAQALGGDLVESGGNLIALQAAGDPALRMAGRLKKWRTDVGPRVASLSVITPSRAVVEASQAAGRGADVADRLRRRIIDRAETQRRLHVDDAGNE